MNSEQTSEDSASTDQRSPHVAPSSSKRDLLRAAWVAPLIIATTLPRSSYAANMSGSHGNNGNHGNHFGQLKKGS
jgi:hypothetical protein